MTEKTSSPNQSSNRLLDETSPYLQQHAYNPVDWYAWSEEALAKASEQNKPILLSIGYSACHWCHVMAHESFEDDETAAVMNERFINIKVDREERPDLDKIYQTSQYLLTQRSGGWPLTMFLTPDDQIPFFGGTYFPKQPRHGLPAFKDLLHQVADAFQHRKEEITQQNQSMLEALSQVYKSAQPTQTLDPIVLQQASEQLLQNFDARFGGFGQAPKFPHPTHIDHLLQDWQQTKQSGQDQPRIRHAALFTLEKMMLGGIYDHLGGGFCRYSVDAYWMIPHFEKMLYDNGPLLTLYSHAYQLTHDTAYKQTIAETAKWVMREMQSPEGGYYSSLDADSEGEEGKFYVWSRKEIIEILSEQERSAFSLHFGLDRSDNFEGKYHLHTFVNLPEIAHALGLDQSQCEEYIRSAKKKLFAIRENRVRPGRDEKILTSWNGLMIKGMACAGRCLQKPEWIDSAQSALRFIRDTLWKDNHLLATYKDGKAHLDAYLDDYAFLLDAILEVLQAEWDSDLLHFAMNLANTLLEEFSDPEHGGFFFTGNHHEPLIQRPKVWADEATPSGNGIAAIALTRLGYLLGETRYLEASEKIIRAASAAIAQNPIAHASLLKAYREQQQATEIIILRGTKDNLASWQRAAEHAYMPTRMVFSISDETKDLPLALSTKTSQGTKPIAYICTGTHCEVPVTEFETFEERVS